MPWYGVIQPPDGGFYRPAFHIVKEKSGSVLAIEKGDTIWIISQLFSPWGNLPPALDARIDVAGVEKLDCGMVKFIASESSAWNLLSDMSVVLKNLTTISKKKRISRLWSCPAKPIGQFIQSIRKLESSNELIDWSDKLLKNDLVFDFISYRLSDGTKCAFNHVKKLLANTDEKKVVFWDRWSLPRRLAERREKVDDPTLNLYLEAILNKAENVWGIESKLYSEAGSYSEKESKLAHRLNKKFELILCSQ
ncbi:MAG: hypothetical protein JWP57_867 [Spirosoma sp.]|nr:hypothetical protein [Spirosoma sp.]